MTDPTPQTPAPASERMVLVPAELVLAAIVDFRTDHPHLVLTDALDRAEGLLTDALFQPAPASSPSVGEVLEMLAEYVEAEAAEMPRRAESARLEDARAALLDLDPAHLKSLAEAQPAPAPAPADAGLREALESVHADLASALQASSVSGALTQQYVESAFDTVTDALACIEDPTPPAGAGAARARLEAERDLHDRLCSEHHADLDRWYAHLMLMQVATDRLRLLDVEEHHLAALAQAQADGGEAL